MSDGAFCHYCQRATCVCRDGFLFDQMKRERDEARQAAQEMLQALVVAGSISTDDFLARYEWLKQPKTGVVWACRCEAWNWACEVGWVCRKCGTHARECGLPGLKFGAEPARERGEG